MSDELYRRLHLLWFGEPLEGRISEELKLRLLALVHLLTPEEEASLERDFSQLFARMQLDAASAPITLARLRELEARALRRMKLPGDDP